MSEPTPSVDFSTFELNGKPAVYFETRKDNSKAAMLCSYTLDPSPSSHGDTRTFHDLHTSKISWKDATELDTAIQGRADAKIRRWKLQRDRELSVRKRDFLLNGEEPSEYDLECYQKQLRSAIQMSEKAYARKHIELRDVVRELVRKYSTAGEVGEIDASAEAGESAKPEA